MYYKWGVNQLSINRLGRFNCQWSILWLIKQIVIETICTPYATAYNVINASRVMTLLCAKLAPKKLHSRVSKLIVFIQFKLIFISILHENRVRKSKK